MQFTFFVNAPSFIYLTNTLQAIFFKLYLKYYPNYSITFSHPSGASIRPIWIPVNVSYNF